MLNSSRFRFLYLLIFILAIAIGGWRLPAYASRLPWLLLLALIDLYFFWHLRPGGLVKKNKYRKARLIIILLPGVLLLFFLFSMLFFSPVDWHPVIRTYLLGIVVMFYLSRIPMLIALIIHNLIFFFRPVDNERESYSCCRWLFGFAKGLSNLMETIILFAMIFWVYDFQFEHIYIDIKDLPDEFKGYKIVQISDLHLGRWHSDKPLKEAVYKINSWAPDLIVFTGDLVNYSTDEALPFAEALSKLKARDGVFTVLGNHDYGDYMRWPDPESKEENLRRMYNFMDEIGWTLLENRNVKITRDDHCLTLIGTGYFSTKKYIPNRADLPKAFEGVDDSCLKILLTHTPELISSEVFQEYHAELILAGHTHALQMGLSLSGKLRSPAALVYDHWGGLYNIGSAEEGRGYLYVNRGLGHIAFPFRIGAWPEITVLYLFEE